MPVIVATEKADFKDILTLLRAGVNDFITAPIRSIDVLPRIQRLIEQHRRNDKLVCLMKEKLGLKEMVGKNPAFKAEINKIPHIARCDTSVMISGETGTGKELCARAIHYLGPRAGKPFVPVNCGAIPTELVENELFGHVKGAFTGALASKSGLIKEADGGTLFLDEIDCLPLPSQVKLLRFINEKEYRPLGSAKTNKAELRIISATNLNMERAVEEGRFRRDLFYRLNVIPLSLPPLRERKEDVPLLVSHFLNKYSDEFNKGNLNVSSGAMQKLLHYEWPGNVRELENVIERAIVFSAQATIQGADIILPQRAGEIRHESFRKAKSAAVTRFERDYIHRLLITHRGNISKAARAAEKNRRAFWELIRKHKIDVQNYTSRDL